MLFTNAKLQFEIKNGAFGPRTRVVTLMGAGERAHGQVIRKTEEH